MRYLYLYLMPLILAGCNKFLDVEPDNRAKVESPSDVQELLVNAYPQATYHLICEMMSDNVRDRGFGENCITEITDDEMYQWKDGTSSDYDSPFALWTGLYEGISASNYAIRVIESKPNQADYRPMLGEALMCRAFNHFLLLQLWAEAYDPATAETAMGIPYVREPETVAVKGYTRNTMAQTLEFMEEDIRRAIPMIDDRIYKYPKYHFTKRAAHAFAAKFYTYKGNEWDKVLAHADKAISLDFSNEIRNIKGNVAAETRQDQAKLFTDPSENAILLSVCVPTYYNDIYARCPIANSRYVMTPAMESELFYNRTLAGTWIYRKQVFGMTGKTAFQMMKNYAYFKATSATSNAGMTYVNEPMLTVEDVLFNRMEAHVMLGDTTSFLRDMNLYLPTRLDKVVDNDNNPNNNTKVSMRSTNSLVQVFSGAEWNDKKLEPYYKAELEANEDKMAGMMAVALCRHFEFFQEGQRWFDIKRFHLPVSHYLHWEGRNIELGRYDSRRVLQVPQEAQKIGVAAWPRE